MGKKLQYTALCVTDERQLLNNRQIKKLLRCLQDIIQFANNITANNREYYIADTKSCRIYTAYKLESRQLV